MLFKYYACGCCYFLSPLPLVNFVSHHFPLLIFVSKSQLIVSLVEPFTGFSPSLGNLFFFFSLCALILTTSFWNARSSMKCLRMGFKLNPHWRMLCFEDLFWGNYFFVISSCSSFGEASIGFHGTQWLEIDPFILNSTVQNRVLPKPWTVLYAIYYFFLISDFSFCILFHITAAKPSLCFLFTVLLLEGQC